MIVIVVIFCRDLSSEFQRRSLCYFNLISYIIYGALTENDVILLLGIYQFIRRVPVYVWWGRVCVFYILNYFEIASFSDGTLEMQLAWRID